MKLCHLALERLKEFLDISQIAPMTGLHTAYICQLLPRCYQMHENKEFPLFGQENLSTSAHRALEVLTVAIQRIVVRENHLSSQHPRVAAMGPGMASLLQFRGVQEGNKVVLNAMPDHLGTGVDPIKRTCITTPVHQLQRARHKAPCSQREHMLWTRQVLLHRPHISRAQLRA